MHWRCKTRGIRWTEILLREESLLVIVFQTTSFHREVSLVLFKEEIKRRCPRHSSRGAWLSIQLHSEIVHLTSSVNLLCMYIHTPKIASWCFLTINTLEWAVMRILGVDKNTDGWLKRSFNPASNELIWNKLPATNYHLVLIDSSPALLLLFHKLGMNCWV